jgi:hypothetical protein
MVSAVVADEQSGLMKVTIAVDGGDAMTVLEGEMVSAVVSDEQSGLMKVTIAVDGGDAMTVLEGPDNVVNRQQVSHEATGLTAGMHEVVVVAESMGGPTTYSWTFTVDETPPEIASGMPQSMTHPPRSLQSHRKVL